MRLKAGILLMGLLMLFSLGGCVQQGNEQQDSTAPAAAQAVQDAKTGTQAGEFGQKNTVSAGQTTENSLSESGDKKPSEKLDGKATDEVVGAANEASEQSDPAQISITGPGVKESRAFTLDELKQMQDISVSAIYFSRGAEKPGWGKTAHTDFKGVLLYELLANHVGLNAGASRVKVIAEDGYTQIFSLDDLKAIYIDETDAQSSLRIMIAWSQDGQEYDPCQGAPFRLVVGQQFAGDYNRQKWVNQIASLMVE